MGTVFRIPWTRLGTEPADWPERGMETLRSFGFTTAAMALSPGAADIRDERLKRAEKVALLLGTEGSGLSGAALRAADLVVKIPMLHGVDSLNVAAASAVAFWELLRED